VNAVDSERDASPVPTDQERTPRENIRGREAEDGREIDERDGLAASLDDGGVACLARSGA
jgi:hypothetical protein